MISRSGVGGLNFTKRSSFILGSARASRAANDALVVGILITRMFDARRGAPNRSRGRLRCPFQIVSAVPLIISRSIVRGQKFTNHSNFATGGLHGADRQSPAQTSFTMQKMP